MLANEEHALLAVAYMYKAAQSEGILKGTWADMGVVILEQSHASAFVGNPRMA